jgi:uncharacterized protein (TIGR03084 family)
MSAPELSELLDDLAAECAELDALVAGLDDAGWRTPTPSPGWTIAHQVAHLAWTDEIAVQAITDPTAFASAVAALAERAARLDGYVDEIAGQGADTTPALLLDRWRVGRDRLTGALGAIEPDDKISWFGPPMSPRSMATARLMETWAHGLDVADALGITREPTARLRHVAHLAVRAMPYAFAVHGRPQPTVQVRVELAAPGGQTWTWGPADAADRVTGPALDFCLLMTQRRHRADLALVATGEVADAWLDVGQAFAGPPGAGRAPSGALR